MTTLMQASRQWATRPQDERYLSLTDMAEHFAYIRDRSEDFAISKEWLTVEPVGDDLAVIVKGRHRFTPTNIAFDQLARAAGTSPEFVRDLSPALAADVLNFHLGKARKALPAPAASRVRRLDIGASDALSKADDASILVQYGEDDEEDAPQHTLRAVLGPRYGRIWNADVINLLTDKFGDGRTGDFRVPGEFGKEVAIHKGNTTLYASDRDMFIMLADEKNRVELPGRRGGNAGALARGFMIENSEVGDRKFCIRTFYFDYICANRIVWGAQNVIEVSMKHTLGAPARFAREFVPQLMHLAQSSDEAQFLAAVNAARMVKLDDSKCAAVIGNVVGKRKVIDVYRAHEADEGRPIETLYDVTNGLTAYARSIPFASNRSVIEVEAGKLLAKAA